MHYGIMTPDQFKASGQSIFGKSGWKGQVADALHIHRATVWRYVTGERPIPETIALAMEALAAREKLSA